MSDYSKDDVEGFMRSFKLLVLIAAIVVASPLVVYLFYLDHRLDSFEGALAYRAPEALEGAPAPRYLDYLPAGASHGQTVYVPAYSHVYHQDGQPHLLTVTLSARNTSRDRDIILESVTFFDTRGKRIRSFLDQPLRVGPLATTEFLVGRDDQEGGSGANFIVQWYSEGAVTAPVIEAVMIDTTGKQGISFAREGRVIEEADGTGE